MPIATSENITESISTLNAANRSVYEWKHRNGTPKFTETPHFIYFYYMKFETNGQPNIVRYDLDNGDTAIPYDSVGQYINEFAQKCRAGTAGQPSGIGIDGSVWERKSYVAFVMDNPVWRFVRYGSNDEAAIIFNPLKGSTNNHSFFDASDHSVDIIGDGSEFVTGFWMMNHMKKNPAGDDIKYKTDGHTRDSQRFIFDLYYEVTILGSGTDVFIHDPTGTNLGPPVGPP